MTAPVQSPVAEDLRRLLLKSYGPAHVLAKLLKDVAGVEEAKIFGSWAARAAGEEWEDDQTEFARVVREGATVDVMPEPSDA